MLHQARVTGLYIYPVKSCRGFLVNELKMNAQGPEFDRQWMIVDEKNHFITLRNFAQMALVKTSIQGSFLHLYAGHNKILIDTTKECEQIEDVTIWGKTFQAGIENRSINEALSDFFSKTVKLVRYQSQSFRDLEESATDVVKETRFSDSKPLLLTNEASLQDLNKKLKDQDEDPSFIERFRPNIVVEGFLAYDEEKFTKFKVGEVEFLNSKLCGRCPVVTQDVETGKVVSKATLTTLAKDRKKEGSSKIAFGVYLTPASLGAIKIGDKVTAYED